MTKYRMTKEARSLNDEQGPLRLNRLKIHLSGICFTVYSVTGSRCFMVATKVFQSGRSQAVRVPKRYRFRSTEVNVMATPDGLLFTEKAPWDLFREGVAELSDDFMHERIQPALESREFGE